MIAYLVMGNYGEEPLKAKNNAMIGFFPVFHYLSDAKAYAKPKGLPVLSIDTDADVDAPCTYYI
jgi:hypothetical protein